jgi:hypothetical protein
MRLEFWRIPLHRDRSRRVIEAVDLDAKLLQHCNIVVMRMFRGVCVPLYCFAAAIFP